MPSLVVFAACQKAIISERDDSLSLIALLENISVPVIPGIEVPRDAKAPSHWDIVVYWRRSLEDDQKSYDQKTALVLPDGTETLDTILNINLSNGVQTARNIINVIGFPVGQAGECKLQLSIKETNRDEPWTAVADYILTVIHERQPVDEDLEVS